MPVKIKNKIVIPQKELDSYWMEEIRISAVAVNGQAHATVIMRPYNKTTMEAGNERKVVNIRDIMAKIAAGNKKLGAALKTIQDAVQAEIDAEQTT